jgi:hypothetical protein
LKWRSKSNFNLVFLTHVLQQSLIIKINFIATTGTDLQTFLV